MGYCGLLINGVKGSDLRGKIAAALQNHISGGRSLFFYLSATGKN